MRLTIVGCSGSIPGPDSPASCYLIEEQGFRLLLDLGAGALGALQRYANIYEIDAVCLSHLHPDHCVDMTGYWVARTYSPAAPYPRIPVYGPPGTARRLARAQGADGDEEMTGAFDFRDLRPGPLEIGPLRLTLAHMNHPVETFGFRIEAGGGVLAYSADTGESAELVTLARDAGVLLCEASFLDGPGLPEGLHLTARQAAEHAAAARAGHLLLTHLVPWNDRDRTREEAAAVFEGQLTLATSGLVVDVG